MIYLAVGESVQRLALTGPGTQSPFAAVSYPRPGGEADVVNDTLDLGLEGSPADILEGLAALERWLAAARQAGSKAPGEVSIFLKEADGEASLSSPLLDGWVERLSGQRSSRSMAVRLHIRRLNYWEDPVPVWLPLSNLHGQDQVFLQVDNACSPSLRTNALEASPDEGYGGLPMPLIVRIENNSPGSLGELLVYKQQIASASPEFFAGWLEGEAASGGSGVSEPLASGGAFNRLTWSGSTEQELCSWQLSSASLLLAAGKIYQPLLRFQLPPPAGTRLRLRLKDGDFTLWEGQAAYTCPGEQLQALPGLPLPPLPLAQDPLKPLALVLAGRITSPGEHAIDLDAVQLAPLDGWRRLGPLAAGVPQGGVLTDDNRRGCVYQSSPYHQADYAGLGPTLTIQPGERFRLVFFQTGMDGTAAPDRSLTASLAVCRRFRKI